MQEMPSKGGSPLSRGGGHAHNEPSHLTYSAGAPQLFHESRHGEGVEDIASAWAEKVEVESRSSRGKPKVEGGGRKARGCRAG